MTKLTLSIIVRLISYSILLFNMYISTAVYSVLLSRKAQRMTHFFATDDGRLLTSGFSYGSTCQMFIKFIYLHSISEYCFVLNNIFRSQQYVAYLVYYIHSSISMSNIYDVFTTLVVGTQYRLFTQQSLLHTTI